MDAVKFYVGLLTITSLLLVAIGLYKPWIVLWWKDIQDRKMVLKFYGIPFVVLGLIYLILLLL